jgi:hypothetical protein
VYGRALPLLPYLTDPWTIQPGDLVVYIPRIEQLNLPEFEVSGTLAFVIALSVFNPIALGLAYRQIIASQRSKIAISRKSSGRLTHVTPEAEASIQQSAFWYAMALVNGVFGGLSLFFSLVVFSRLDVVLNYALSVSVPAFLLGWLSKPTTVVVDAKKLV